MAEETCEHKLSWRDHADLTRSDFRHGKKIVGDPRRKPQGYRPEDTRTCLEEFRLVFGPCLICNPEQDWSKKGAP